MTALTVRRVRASIYDGLGRLKPAVARWQNRSLTTDMAAFSSCLAEVLNGPPCKFKYVLKTTVGSRGEIVLKAGDIELVFYSPELQFANKGKEVLLTAEYAKDQWSLICSTDQGRSIFCRRYFDQELNKLYIIDRNRPSDIRVFYDRLDEKGRIKFGGIDIAFDHNWHSGAPVRIFERNGKIEGIRVRDRGDDVHFYTFKDKGKVRFIFVGHNIQAERIPDFLGDVFPALPLQENENRVLFFHLGDRYYIREHDRERFGLKKGSLVISRFERSHTVGYRTTSRGELNPFIQLEDIGGALEASMGKKVQKKHQQGIRLVSNKPSFLTSNLRHGKRYYYEDVKVGCVTYRVRRVMEPEVFCPKRYSLAIDFSTGEALLLKEGKFNKRDRWNIIVTIRDKILSYIPSGIFVSYLLLKYPDFKQYLGTESGLALLERNQANFGAHSLIEKDIFGLLMFDDSRAAGLRMLMCYPKLLEKLYFELKDQSRAILSSMMD